MDNISGKIDDIRLHVQNANKTPVKEVPTHKITGSNTYRLGNFAKTLLEKAQSTNSDLKLSPNTIQALVNPMRTRQIQIPGCGNLLREKKIVPEEKVDKCSEEVSAPTENNENGVQSLDPSRTGPNPISAHIDPSPDKKAKSEAITLPLMYSTTNPTILKGQPLTLPNENEETNEIHTGNISSPQESPWRPRTVPMPIYEDVSTPNDKTKIVTPCQTMMNPKMRTYPLLNHDEHSSELMVAYRQTNDALSSEIRPYSHNMQSANKQEVYTPQYRNNINMHANSEVAVRMPPMLPLVEQNSNVGPRMHLPNQMHMGIGTPVHLPSAIQKFRPPSSSGKGKIGNFNTKKSTNAGNSWKFRSETVDGKEYLRMKELGKGGCGSVDLVIEKESRELYALKKVNLAGMDESVVQECVNEIEMLMELRDTDLVIRIFSWEMNHAEKSMKIVMEYGQCDLNSSIKSINSSIIRLKYIWERLLMIVATIHSRGIVHADLKPANFVWVGDSLKIIDFGISNRLQSDHTSIATLNPKGTMNFISPETIRPDATGKTKISPKSDIWSLGCILYMMVYGKTPFQDITHYVAKINAISLGSVTYPNLSSNLQYSGVVGVLKSCFELDPKARPTAADLLKHTFLY